MPQLRQDLVTGRWVAIATERAKRPSSFSRAQSVAVPPGAQCPFCPGHESMTPPEVMAYREPGTAPNTPGWEIRVVPNLFPAFGPPNGEPTVTEIGPYQAMNGVGVHEVLIASPDHFRDLPELPPEKVELVVRSFQDRFNANQDNPNVQYLLLINNHGKEAGASLEHPHSQLFGIPMVPPNVQEEIDGLKRYRREHGSCGYCDVIANERKAEERVIFENPHFLVYAPFASRTPFEMQIIPTWHTARFETMTPEQRRDFAEALHQATARLTKGLNNPPYNFYVHTAPNHAGADLDHHWHVEILPKLAIAAGFELGSGIMINVATPEAAAEFLRQVDLAPASPPGSRMNRGWADGGAQLGDGGGAGRGLALRIPDRARDRALVLWPPRPGAAADHLERPHRPAFRCVDFRRGAGLGERGSGASRPIPARPAPPQGFIPRDGPG